MSVADALSLVDELLAPVLVFAGALLAVGLLAGYLFGRR